MADKSNRKVIKARSERAMEPMPGMTSQSLLRFDPNFETFANHLSMPGEGFRRMKLPPWLMFPLGTV